MYIYAIVNLNKKKTLHDILQEDRSNSMTIGIADDHIGLIVGRGGRNIVEISQVIWMLQLCLFHSVLSTGHFNEVSITVYINRLVGPR